MNLMDLLIYQYWDLINTPLQVDCEHEHTANLDK